ncbi:hypothetical protein OBBRIDRAFT_826068 [Obba rivulosa]|uniref:Protein kinase domain-containing protein n=1 Tax=Obba rivulosa TaxID=1052685 RepID=A0A8E2AXV9_9APHY|nr:hypothetical protein OBBRIDRAFT_826068 [Obba rivulosa]
MPGDTSIAETVPQNTSKVYDGTLEPEEIWWRDHQLWLQERGYQLRPRFSPGWIPSWKGTDKKWWECEDGLSPSIFRVLDAVRTSDGAMVSLKQISQSDHPYETEISMYLSSSQRGSDPRNHCVPVYEVLDVPDDPDMKLLVMPLLRPYDDPPLETVGEAVEFFRQIFEGLQFIHENHVAHRDCMNLNIMVDPKPLYPDMYHPHATDLKRDWSGFARHYTRTKEPTKYIFIDFGISRKYGAEEKSPREYPIWGGDKTVPEFHRSNDPCNPFPTDIYYLGNLIREDFLQSPRGVEFMEPLVSDMVQDDPSKRPTIDEVISRFAELRKSLSRRKLRSRLVDPEETKLLRFYRNTRHIFRTAYYIMARHSAVPTPKPVS